MALASDVLPTPGTSSMRRCPSAKRHTSARRTCSDLPWMTRSTLPSSASKSAAKVSPRGAATGCTTRNAPSPLLPAFGRRLHVAGFGRRLMSPASAGGSRRRHGAGVPAAGVVAARQPVRRSLHRHRRAYRRRPVDASRFWARGTLLVVARPGLWGTALRQAGRLARPRWWRPPALPAGARSRVPEVPARDAVRRGRCPRSGRPRDVPRVVPGDGATTTRWRASGPTGRLPPTGARGADAVGRALLLNASFEPLCVVSARRAVVLVLKEKAEIVERNGADAPLRARRLPGPVGDPPRPLRAGAVPDPRAALAARRVRPRRPPVPVLQPRRREHRPRRPALARRPARVGQRRRLVPLVQRPQGGPPPGRGRPPAAPRPARAACRASGSSRPPGASTRPGSRYLPDEAAVSA